MRHGRFLSILWGRKWPPLANSCRAVRCSLFLSRYIFSKMDPRSDRDENLSLTSSTGRIIGYARYGVEKSKFPTIIYLHGYPGTRIEAAMFSKDLFASGLKMIAIDRPGFGLSSPELKLFDERSILDHVEEVRSIVDHLQLDKFVIAGISGGGPYALACAHAFPVDRVVGVLLVVGMGPYKFAMDNSVWKRLFWLNKIGFTLPVKLPRLYEFFYRLVVPWLVSKFGNSTYDQVLNSSLSKYGSAKNREVFTKGGEELYKDNIRNIQEAIRQKDFAHWHVDEARLLSKPWPFELEDVNHPNIRLYYGSSDNNTPKEMGELIQNGLNENAKLTIIENGTHASVMSCTVQWIKELLDIK